MNHRLLLLPCLLALAAPLHAQRPAARPRDRISPAEVRASAATDGLQLVRSLRPGWLTRRDARLGTVSAAGPRRDPEGPIAEAEPRATQTPARPEEESAGVLVIVDGALLGGPDALRDIRVDQIESLEFATPEQARLRYARTTRAGAIVVHRRGAHE
jgi:hypothetical protein